VLSIDGRWAHWGLSHPKVGPFSTSPVSILNHGMKLVIADEKKTVIAEFHTPHYLIKRQKARLEVQPAGMDMLDYIILTFAFAERKRREREGRAKSYGG